MRLCLTHGLHPKAPCPLCVSEKDARRGNPTSRGIGPNHRALASQIRSERLPCSLCSQPYGDPSNPITVGHIIDRASFRHPLEADTPTNLQPECWRCNRGSK